MTFRVGLRVQPLRLRDVGQHTWHCSPSTLTSAGVPDARTDMASSRTTRHRDLFVSLSVWAAPRPARNRNHSRRCSSGRRRRRATAGRRTAPPGRIGWQVLVMLARAAGAPRVTTQYELVRKAEISPFARTGTSGVRGPLQRPPRGTSWRTLPSESSSSYRAALPDAHRWSCGTAAERTQVVRVPSQEGPMAQGCLNREDRPNGEPGEPTC